MLGSIAFAQDYHAEATDRCGLGRARQTAGFHRRLGDRPRRRRRPGGRSGCRRPAAGGSRSSRWRGRRRCRRARTCGRSAAGTGLDARVRGEEKSATRCGGRRQPVGELSAARHARHHGPALSDGVSSDARPGHDRDRGLSAGATHLHGRASASRRSRSEVPRLVGRTLGRRYAGRRHRRLLADDAAGGQHAAQRQDADQPNGSGSPIPTR